MGDFKADQSLWHCTLEENQRGTNLADQINESNYGVLNEDFPTRITPQLTRHYNASPSLQLLVHHYFYVQTGKHNLL